MKLLLRGLHVVDPRDGTVRRDQDVLVDGDLILSVSPTAGDVPDGARLVDVAGQWAIPGFVDMHAHPLSAKDPRGALTLMLAYGITGFRQLSGSDRMLKSRSGLVPDGGPRLFGMPGAVLTPANAGTAGAAIATIRAQHGLGADFIKSALVRREVFVEAQAEANRLGIAILGHLPKGIDVARVSADGMRSIEHLGTGVGLLSCCTPDPAAVQQEAALRPEPKLPAVKLPFLEAVLDRLVAKLVINPINLYRQPDVDLLDRTTAAFAQDAASTLAQQLAANGTWQVPTLIRSQTQHLCDDPQFRDDPDLRYVAPATIKAWTKATAKFSAFPASTRETFERTYETMLRLTKLLDEAGVPLLAGSDACGAAWVVPGPSLHHELDQLAAAGLSPLRVLQTATSAAAEFLGTTSTMGTVEPGKHADLVLLEDDPRTSVAHLHAIAGVVRQGRLLDRAELAAMKDRVAADRSVT